MSDVNECGWLFQVFEPHVATISHAVAFQPWQYSMENQDKRILSDHQLASEQGAPACITAVTKPQSST